jgi:hypothetical protein
MFKKLKNGLKEIFCILRCLNLFVHNVPKKINKNGTKTRILYFYDKGEVKTEIQSYKCKKCGKKIQQVFYNLYLITTTVHMNLKVNLLN